MITKDDIQGWGDPLRVELPNGWYAELRLEPDRDAGPPWENDCMYGPVSEWTRRAKRPGERVLCQDGGAYRYYDFAESVKLARRDGWGGGVDEDCGCCDMDHPSTFRVAALAAETRFELLREWCEGQWEYVGIIVALFDADDNPVASDSLWCVESYATDHHRELAAEMVNGLAAGLVIPNPAAEGNGMEGMEGTVTP